MNGLVHKTCDLQTQESYPEYSREMLALKRLPTKAEIRAHLEEEIAQFRSGGGSVTKVPTGLSGNDPQATSAPHTRRLFIEPTVTRTHIPEVVAAIEARRKEKLKHKPSPKKPRQHAKRKRKTIYDDFGEALRTVWVDE